MIKVTLFQLLQWKHWLQMEIRVGRACRHSSGRSVRAHAARHFGLRPRSDRRVILYHIAAAIKACQEVNAPLGAVVELVQD